MSSKTAHVLWNLDADVILNRLRSGKRVRRSIRPWGRLNIDRPLPYLCAYRMQDVSENQSTAQLVTGLSAYMTVSAKRKQYPHLAAFLGTMSTSLALDFGAFLLFELWARHPTESGDVAEDRTVRILYHDGAGLAPVVEELEAAIGQIQLPTLPRLRAVAVSRHRVAPLHLQPLIKDQERAASPNCHVMGIEIPKVYLSEEGTLYPTIHRALRRRLTQAINRAVYRFMREYTSHRPPHFQALGRRFLTKAAFVADADLAHVSGQFDFLLLTTPRNTDEAWHAFRRRHFERPPTFSYRPPPFDVVLAKRALYEIHLEHIEDPTVADLFRSQQDEIDRKLTMIADRGTRRFVFASLQLYGGVDGRLLKQAVDILERISPHAKEPGRQNTIDSQAMAARAKEEIQFLRQQYDKVTSRVEVRPDITGLMVSHGNLLIGSQGRIPASRVEALIQHEVGTHVLTYFNAMAQPIRQLRVGLPGYEELQEGLAVLAEYLVGGLSRPRLRLLALRVLAVARMLDGASFIDVFRELEKRWQVGQRVAFTTTMRAFRGGGHTKDAVYLRGLIALLAYLQNGGALEPLFIGKIGLQHVSFIKELVQRQVLQPVPLRARYLDLPETQRRLKCIRDGLAVHDLASPITPIRRRVTT
jgi:uncharacterized protein (TIGR02421 family)